MMSTWGLLAKLDGAIWADDFGERIVQNSIVGNRGRRNFLKIRFLQVPQEPGEALDRLAVRSGKDI